MDTSLEFWIICLLALFVPGIESANSHHEVTPFEEREESQQVSLITTLNYLPVEANKHNLHPDLTNLESHVGEGDIRDPGNIRSDTRDTGDIRNDTRDTGDIRDDTGAFQRGIPPDSIIHTRRNTKENLSHNKLKELNNQNIVGGFLVLEANNGSDGIKSLNGRIRKNEAPQVNSKGPKNTNVQVQKKLRDSKKRESLSVYHPKLGNGRPRRRKVNRYRIITVKDSVQESPSTNNIVETNDVSENIVFGQRKSKELNRDKKHAPQTIDIPSKRISSVIKKISNTKYGKRRRSRRKRPKTLNNIRNNKRIATKLVNLPHMRTTHETMQKKKIVSETTNILSNNRNISKKNVPVSIFIRSKDIVRKKQKHPKLRQDNLLERNNEIFHDAPRKITDAANTDHKPVVVTRHFKALPIKEKKTQSESKKVSARLIPIPLMKSDKSQQPTFVSHKKLKPLQTGKKSKPKAYKHFKAKDSSHHKTAGGSVEKGGSESSGYDNKDYKDYGKDHNSKFGDKEAKDYNGEEEDTKYEGERKAGKEASEGHAHGDKGHHHKGYRDQGFKDVHHKMEYGSKENFYHDDEDQKNHNVFDEFDVLFAKKMADNIKGHNFDNGHYSDDRGHKGESFDDYFDDYMKEHDDIYGHDDHHHHYHGHGHKGHNDRRKGHNYHDGHNKQGGHNHGHTRSGSGHNKHGNGHHNHRNGHGHRGNGHNGHGSGHNHH